MVPVLVLANNFIKEAKNGKIKDLTRLKLQKLLYFTYGLYAADYEEPLFSENFLAWQYGPVLSSVYHEFKVYVLNEIKKCSSDAEGMVFWMNMEAPSNERLRAVFNIVCNKYANISGIDLSKKTYENKSPWGTTKANGLIQFEKIKEYFTEQKKRTIKIFYK